MDSLAASNLSDWIKSYKSEVEGFASTSVNAALRYEEVLAATAGLERRTRRERGWRVSC